MLEVASSDLAQPAHLTCTTCDLYNNLWGQLIDVVAEVALLAADACTSEPVCPF